MATSKRWKDRNTQEQKENTSWHNIVVFNEGLVDVIEKYVKKGSKIYVEGHLCWWSEVEYCYQYTNVSLLLPL